MATIKIYSTPSCVYCRMAKEFFKEHDVAYEEFNVAEDAAKREEMVQKTGQLGVPVLDVDGEIIVGFDKPKLMELLKITS
jgi:glutaredoxin 3